MQSIDNSSGIVDESMFERLMHESHSRAPTGNNGMFPPTGSPTGDKFISSLSVTMVIIFFVMLRSSASPFLNPTVS